MQACGAGSAFSQLRTAAAVEALHAAQFSRFGSLLLASSPALAEGLQAALRFMPKLGQRLTVCAVWANVCCAELDESKQSVAVPVPLGSAVCDLLRMSPHPHCSKSAEQGVFQTVHRLLLLGMTVGRQRSVL